MMISKPLPGILFLVCILLFSSPVFAQQLYYPPAGAEWETRSPEDTGFNAGQISNAVHFAIENENSVEKDLRIAILKGFEHEPYHTLEGPVRERGVPSGLIIKDGYIVTSWGEPGRVDMTFSVTKSYLSAVAGVARDKRLIEDIHSPVKNYVWDRTFDGEHNSKISWHHLLRQTSDWYGTLFGMEDWSDRPPRSGGIDDWRYRELHEPGTHYKYNDVRVNLLAYSLLQVFREPIPMILKREIMDPIGASTTWRWFGYNNSFVMVDGIEMQSVSGGGHNGGGMFIHSYDHARFGLLFARNGMWEGQQVLSKEWIDQSAETDDVNPDYGYLWWTLGGNTQWEGVPEHVFYAAGFGGNYIVVDRENDLVIVARWIDSSKIGEFVSQIYQAME